MIRTTIALLPLLVASCSVNPVVRIGADGSKTISLGGSVFEDSKLSAAEVRLPDGTSIAFRKEGASQTKVPLSGIRTWGTVASITELWKGQNEAIAIPERGQTSRAAIEAGTDQARIQADVTKATFVPPELP